MLEKLFKLKERNTSVRTEIGAGVTTFMTMAYILAVNPSVLGSTGMDTTAVLLATCFASFIGTMIMGLAANLPFALSAGMGLNAFFAYSVVGMLGYPWQVALLAVFIEGVIFIILSLTKIREAIFNCIPLSLKKAVSVGIGLFICFIGLQNAGLAVDADTLVSLTSFREDFNTSGICALLTVIGTLVTAALYIKKVPGSMLIGIFGTWALGIFCELIGLYIPNPDTAHYTLVPHLHMTDFSTLGNTFGQCFNVELESVGTINFVVVVLSFLFVDLFDTIGTLIGVSSKAKMLDEKGALPGIRPALMADAVATTSGAVLGTSTVSTFVESAAGVGAGGRTGLTAVVTAVLFLASTLFSSLFTAIPSFATAPALIIVGFLMFTTITEIKLDEENFASAVPAYLCIAAMPLFYSISEGIALGVISYVVINLICGKRKEINPLMYVLTLMFILKYIFL